METAVLDWMKCAACGPDNSAGDLAFCGTSDVEKDSWGPVVPIFVLPLQCLEVVGRMAAMEDVAQHLVPYTRALGSLIFVSHQWGSFADPDPTRAQYELLVAALELAGRDDGAATPPPASPPASPGRRAPGDARPRAGGLRECVRDPRGCFLWCDSWSAPQRDAEALARSVRHLPFVLEQADAMVVLSPPGGEHLDTGEALDLARYASRGWCRLEQYAVRAPRAPGQDEGPPVYVFDDASALAPKRAEEKGDALSKSRGGLRFGASAHASVFRGGFACCERKHVFDGADVACDKQALAEVVMGVFEASVAASRGADDLGAYRELTSTKWARFDGWPYYAPESAALDEFLGDLRLSGPAAVDRGTGLTATHYAAATNDARLLRECVEKGGDARAVDAASRTPLHVACEVAAPATVRALLEARADVDACCDGGATPLAVLVSGPPGCYAEAIATALLDAGARPDAITGASHALPHSSLLVVACANGHFDVADVLVQRGADARARAADTSPFAGRCAVDVARASPSRESRRVLRAWGEVADEPPPPNPSRSGWG